MAFEPLDTTDPAESWGPLKQQPDPLICECGSVRTWALWPNKESRAYGQRQPRWCAPRVNPCGACEADWTERDAERRLVGRQKAIGMGDRDRPWRWSSTKIQGPAQNPEDFQAQIRRAHPQTIGILRKNEIAARAIASWTPDCGHSIYLAGMTGSGKTVMAAALATRLLGGKSGGRIRLTQEQGRAKWGDAWPRVQLAGRGFVVQQSVSWQVVFCPDSDLYEREKQSWSKDRTPLARIVDADALILDDLGETGSDPLTGGRMPPGYVEMIQKLVRRRYSEGRNLVITSNVPMRSIPGKLSGVRDWFGDRVHSRLVEMTQGHVYHLQSVDWRRP